MDSLNITFFVFALLGVALGVIMMVYWIRVLIDCASNEARNGNEKIIWLIIIFFGGLLGALLYVFIRRPQRIAEFGH